MTPLDAWRVISRNLANYYRMRCTETFKGYDDADTEAEVIAFKALKKMEEQEKVNANERNLVEKGFAGPWLGYTRVEDGLPPEPGRYLCIWKGPDCPEGMEDVLNFSGEYFHLERAFAPGKFVVTHWMPLPSKNNVAE